MKPINTLRMIMILLLAGVLLLVGVRGILTYQQQKSDVLKSKSYAKAMGEIDTVELWYRIEENKEGGDIPMFELVKSYEYTVDATLYKSKNSHPFELDHLKYYTPISKILPHHRWILETEHYTRALSNISTEVGEEVMVYYDENNPQESTLTQELQSIYHLRYAAYCLMVLLAMGLFYYSFRK